MNEVYSQRYRMWKAQIDLRTCVRCKQLHGKIYGSNEKIPDEPPLHHQCRCNIMSLKAKYAGTATNNWLQGADFWLKEYERLPDYYIDRQEAKNAGWVGLLGNLNLVLPGKMIFGGIYKNKNGHLPTAPGRIWYEADINYTGGMRGMDRIVFSNDGLIFVTYDHYYTFIEII